MIIKSLVTPPSVRWIKVLKDYGIYGLRAGFNYYWRMRGIREKERDTFSIRTAIIRDVFWRIN